MSIEDDFKVVFDAHSAEIHAAMDKALAAVQEAEALSEKYGIPFRGSVSPLRQDYIPSSLRVLFPEIDGDKLYDIGVDANISHEYHDEGWAHSAVCY